MLNTRTIPNSYKIKANVLCMCIFVIFSALLYQLIRIQIIDHNKYSSLALTQQFKKEDIPTRRGSIFDRSGLKLAESIQVTSVFADPLNIKNKTKTAKVLSDVLGLKKAVVVDLLNRQKRFVWIKKGISDEQIDVLKQLNLKGVGFRQEHKRVYPYEKLCSQVLGFTDIDENGVEGIEKSLNHVISGSKGSKVVERDGLQHRFSTLREETVSARYGNSVYLTIDCEVQSIVEEELEKACIKWKPDSASAIAMDPSTGEVLAMTSYPSFDPNTVGKSSADQRRNRAIADCFEPGSVIKPLIVSGAIDSGIVDEDKIFPCYNGVFRVGRRVIRDDHPAGEFLSVSGIVVHSSNIGMAQIGILMEKKRLYSLLKSFSFGEKTGIQLPAEAKGIVRPLDKWKRGSSISVAFGYEMMVTPLQLITAFSSIANGGTLLKPKIVSKITDYSGKKVKKKNEIPERVRRVISPEIAREKMSPILEGVVKEGTGKEAMLLTYRVAGKTGTAKKYLKNEKKYSNKYISSFIGYAPVDEPKVCILVSLNEPKNGAYYASKVAAPAVGKIIKKTLDCLEVRGTQFVRTAQR
ncbi:MAG: penicillin-binding protein 2 [Candidatus Brocadiaceae bacterium]|nr:penicillin-binding protein 2 [Candidatus Brocadiaceae bacterium]